MSLLWQHSGTRQIASVNDNRRVAQNCRENIISQEDPINLRDNPQFELFDDAELSRVERESAIYRRDKYQ